MPRTPPEWIGKTDDTPVPDRVRMRVFERNDRTCQCGCGVKIREGMRWETDHTKAVINGGENRERNLRTVLAGDGHHTEKTKADVAEKAMVYRVKKSHYLRKRSSFPCGKDSPFKRKVGGGIVRR